MSREQRLKSGHVAAMRAALDAFVDRPCRLSERQTQALLNELCVKLGFCLTPRDHDAVVTAPPTDPWAFAELVMTLEGVDPADPEMFAPVLEQVLATFVGVGLAGPE
jgi:hypothetical protein